MPELPEVEVLKRHLNQAIVGLTIKSIEVRVPKMFVGDRQAIEGRRVESVDRRHKLLLIHFDNQAVLAIHLKLTGQLIFVKKDQQHGFFGGHPERAYEQPPPHQYTHIIITFKSGDHLYFNDLRKFGWMKVIENGDLGSQNSEYQQLIANFALEPLEANLTLDDFASRLKTRARLTIKQALMDEKRVVAGVGNIYSDETLFCAQIKPLKKVSTLSANEIKNIFRCLPRVLNKAIELGGTSFNTYRHLTGEQGRYQLVAKVYGKAGQRCPRGDGVIVRQKIGGRSTHFCPSCQK